LLPVTPDGRVRDRRLVPTPAICNSDGRRETGSALRDALDGPAAGISARHSRTSGGLSRCFGLGSDAIRAVGVEPFVPPVDEARACVELEASMLDAGVSLPSPRRTVDAAASLATRTSTSRHLSPATNDHRHRPVPAGSLAFIDVHASPSSHRIAGLVSPYVDERLVP
jgi:hypothetical protein